MNEEKNPIPKPTIRNTPPVKPPMTIADIEEPTEPVMAGVAKEEKEEAPAPGGVEADLVKRFLGVFIDAIVAGVIGYLVATITGSSFLQYLAWGLVMLTRDSLPVFDGQSIGKKVMKTKAVKGDGSSLSGDWITGATRNILLAIPFAGLVECFIILTRSGNPEEGLRLGDDWAKTKVIAVD